MRNSACSTRADKLKEVLQTVQVPAGSREDLKPTNHWLNLKGPALYPILGTSQVSYYPENNSLTNLFMPPSHSGLCVMIFHLQDFHLF